MSRRTVEDYHVGWLCALPKEMTAARAMLDEEHDPFKSNGSTDDNNYVLGRIAEHNVVVACLPAGIYGTNAAAVAAIHLQRTFTGLRFGFMVGIGAGAPDLSRGIDIRLGDVVVSQPDGTHGGVVQYDLVKNLGERSIERKGFLKPPPTILLSALSTLQSSHDLKPSLMRAIVDEALQRHPNLIQSGYGRPDAKRDVLHCSHEQISNETSSCAECEGGIVIRKQRENDLPIVHYGLIASGNVLMKNATERDRLRDGLRAKCIEMEAAGLMNGFPCIVVRGICDYADAHKNDAWQKYAALVAAAFAKELLLTVAPATVARERLATCAPGPLNATGYGLPVPTAGLSRYFVGRSIVMGQIKAYLLQADTDTVSSSTVVLFGSGGIGKSQIALKYAAINKSDYDVVLKIDCTEQSSVEADLQDMAKKLSPASGDPRQGSPGDPFVMLNNSQKRWLLIYDGFDKERGAKDWFRLDQFLPPRPSSGTVHIIITSRSQSSSAFGQPIRISNMDSTESRELLLSTSSLQDVTVDADQIGDICDDLCGIPLAIDVAGNYIRQEVCNKQGEPGVHQQVLTNYLQRHRKRREEFRKFLLQSDYSLSTNPSYTMTVYSAWRMSFDYVSSLDGEAAKLLLLLAFIDRRVPAESCYIKTACSSRLRWDRSRTPSVTTAREAGIPEWLLEVVGDTTSLDNDGPGMSSIRLESAINLLIRLSLLKKTTNAGNEHDNWMSHEVFRDCARLHCTPELALELSACALNVFVANYPALNMGESIKLPQHSPGLYEKIHPFLLPGLPLGPFRGTADNVYGWEQVRQAVGAALVAVPRQKSDLDVSITLDFLAFVAKMSELAISCTPFDPLTLSSCLQAASDLRRQDPGFGIGRDQLLFHLCRLRYHLVGRGLSQIDPQSDEIMNSTMISEAVDFLTDPNFLKEDIDQTCLLALSLVLVNINKLFLYNKSEGNPSMSQDDPILESLAARWVNLRHSPFLMRFASKIEGFLTPESSDHILRRARAAVFVEFSQWVRFLPRPDLSATSVSASAPSFASQRRYREVMDITMLALSDLERLGLRHFCATQHTVYLIFDFLGHVRRITDNVPGPLLLPEAGMFLRRHEQALSQQLKRKVQSSLLHELVSGRISDPSWQIANNCASCSAVLFNFNLTQNQEGSFEEQLEAMYARLMLDFDAMLDNAIRCFQSMLSTLDRLESSHPDDYANRDKYEDQIAKFKANTSHMLFDNQTMHWLFEVGYDGTTLVLPREMEVALEAVASPTSADLMERAKLVRSRMKPPSNLAECQSLLQEMIVRFAGKATNITPTPQHTVSQVPTVVVAADEVVSKVQDHKVGGEISAPPGMNEEHLTALPMKPHWAWYDHYRQWQRAWQVSRSKLIKERVRIQLERTERQCSQVRHQTRPDEQEPVKKQVRLSSDSEQRLAYEMESRNWKLENLIEEAEYIRRVGHVDADVRLLDLAARYDWTAAVKHRADNGQKSDSKNIVVK